MYDRDGTNTYSRIIRLTNPFEKSYYKVYQDPDSRKYRLNCVVSNRSAISISIVSASGAIILRKGFGKISSQLDYDFNLADKASGIYFMNVYIDGRQNNAQLLAK